MTFVDILREAGVAFRRNGESGKVTPGWVGMPCPFCRHVSQDGDANLLGVNMRTGAISCWYCGVHRPGETLAALTGWDLRKCIEVTRDTRPVGPPRERPTGRYTPPDGVQIMGPHFALPHRDYVRSRGFDPDYLVSMWHVGAIGVNALLPWRLFIPIEYGGVPVSWTTRSIGNRNPRRYVGAKPHEEAVPAKSLLYGEDFARHAVVVTEGPTKAWAVGPGAVAVMGTGYTRAQVRRIAKYPVRAILFDGEPIAQRVAAKLVNELECFPGVTANVRLESASQADRADRAEIRELRRRFLT